MKNQHQKKKLGLKKLNITLLTTNKLLQIQGGGLQTNGIDCQHSAGCRSNMDWPCHTQTDKDIIDIAYR